MNGLLAKASVAAIGLALCLCGCNSAATQDTKPDTQAATTAAAEPVIKPGCGSYTGQPPEDDELYVKDAGWVSTKSQDGVGIDVAILLANTDDVNCFVFPHVTATAYGADGTVLDTDEITPEFIAPADVMPCSTHLTSADYPDRVEFSISHQRGSVPGHPYTLAWFDIHNTSEQRIDEHGSKWTGEFTNNCEVDFPRGGKVYVLLRKSGALVASYSEQVLSSMPDGSSHPFAITGYEADGIPDHDSFEVYVVPELVF